MGIPNIQACKPENQSCDISVIEETPVFFSTVIKASQANTAPLASCAPATDWEKYQNNAPAYNSLWAPTATLAYRPESVLVSQADREKVLGLYLSSLPTSPEELIPTNVNVALPANTPQKLEEAWPQLPLQVRVYLDNAGLRNEKNLDIAYETENPDFPEGRWHVFNRREEDPTKQMAMAGLFGFGFSKIGAGPTPSGPKAPLENKPSMNVQLGSFIAGTVMVIGMDLGIKKMFPNLPSEARIIPTLGTFYAFQYIFWQAGFTKAATWGEVWRPMTGQLPMMAALGIPTSMLIDGMGKLFKSKALQNGGDLHGPFSILGTLGLHYGLMRTVAGRSFLTASGSGVAGKLGRIVRVGGAALILSALCRGAKSGGAYAGMWMGGLRPGSDGWRSGLLLMEAERIALANLSKDVYGETGGGIVDGALGGLLDAILTIGEMISDDIEKGRQMEIDHVLNKLRDEGDTVSQEIRKNLGIIASNSLDEAGKMDWEKMRQGIAEVYGDPDVMENVYKNFELTGQLNTSIEEVKLAIAVDGSIQNRDKLLLIIRNEFQKNISLHKAELETLRTKQAQLQKLGEEIGYIQVRGGNLYQVPEQFLSPAQHQRMQTEYIPFAGEVVQLELLQEQTGKLAQFVSNKAGK